MRVFRILNADEPASLTILLNPVLLTVLSVEVDHSFSSLAPGNFHLVFELFFLFTKHYVLLFYI